MKYRNSLLILAILFIFIGCSNNNQSNNSIADKSTREKKSSELSAVTIDSNVIKVYVDKNGHISANGDPVSLKELDSSLSKLKNRSGSVYYSRDNAQAEPPAESMKVMDLIVKYGLPVRFYTDNSFTQVVELN